MNEAPCIRNGDYLLPLVLMTMIKYQEMPVEHEKKNRSLSTNIHGISIIFHSPVECMQSINKIH